MVETGAQTRAPRRGGEAALVEAWLRAAPGELHCSDGRRFQLVHRGVAGIGPGPDVRDAILASAAGSLQQGDIEFHLEASGWQSHGHQGDPRYAGVILQVVARPTAIMVLGGAPVYCYQPETPASGAPRWPTMPAAARAGCGLDSLAGDGSLRMAARRLERKAACLEAEANVYGEAEAMWRLLLDVLGYSRNRVPMTRLAALAPLQSLDALARRSGVAHPVLARAGYLLGLAGLAPRAAGAHGSLLAAAVAGKLPAAEMSEAEWAWRTVRPGNRPEQRLIAAAALSDIEAWCATTDELPAALLTVQAASRVHLAGGPSLRLGRDRALQITVNLLAPLRLMRGTATDVIVEQLRRLPVTTPSGRARRLAAALGAIEPAFRVRTALDEQALLEHYDHSCSRQPCWSCLRY